MSVAGEGRGAGAGEGGCGAGEPNATDGRETTDKKQDVINRKPVVAVNFCNSSCRTRAPIAGERRKRGVVYWDHDTD